MISAVALSLLGIRVTNFKAEEIEIDLYKEESLLTVKTSEIKTPKDNFIVLTPSPTPEPELIVEVSEPVHISILTARAIPEPEPAYVEEEPSEEVCSDYVEFSNSGYVGMEYIGDWTVTFYCTDHCCNGQYTGTASGAPLTPWRTAACTALPFGTVVYIEGVGQFVIEDTGVSGNWIDCCVDSHQQALDLGMRTAAVYIVG